MKLTAAIPGTTLQLDSKDRFKSYGHDGYVQPGDYKELPGLGDPRKEWRVAPMGTRWIRDHNAIYWEVSEEELKSNSGPR